MEKLIKFSKTPFCFGLGTHTFQTTQKYLLTLWLYLWLNKEYSGIYKVSLTTLYLQVLLKTNIGSNLHVCTQFHTLLKNSFRPVLWSYLLLPVPRFSSRLICMLLQFLWQLEFKLSYIKLRSVDNQYTIVPQMSR